MSRSRNSHTTPFILLGLVVALGVPAASLAADVEKPADTRLEIGAPVTPFIFDGDLRDLPRLLSWRPGDAVKEIPRRSYPGPDWVQPPRYKTGPDPLLALQQEAAGFVSRAFTAPSRNFAGQGYSGVNPPDTVGDVGPNHYIQMINTGDGADVAIWDKADPTPALITTITLDSLGSGVCDDGFGDPIVLYDRLTDRWMLSEFSRSGNNLCVYVSQTADPVSGGWFAYGFTAPSFPDYPKYGVWPTDANGGDGSYIVTANDGSQGVYALDRGAMLLGNPATFQRVTLPALSGFSFQTATPADLDGPNPPPSGAPAVIMRQRDTENHGGPAAPGDLLEMWGFDVDWINTANTVLSTDPSIDVAEFDSALCGLTAFACFPMPGSGTTLDPLREVIMNRLQYINHGDRQTLVGNFVTDVNGADHGGIRWFELQGGNDAWALEQEGTFAPDAEHRFMAGSSMDQSGNIAIAYNVTSSTVFPSLRYTGRLFSDAPGTMTQPEAVIHDGTAANSSNRYGDYSSMNLDPSDDCTFWFTGMDNTSGNWRTQVASFGFDACGCDLEPSALVASSMVVGDNEIEISWNDADLATVVSYSVGRSTTPGGPYTQITSVPDSSPAVASDPTGYSFVDTDVSGGTTYYYIVRATDGEACTSDDSNETDTVGTGLCTLTPTFAGVVSATTPFSALCTINVAWDAAVANCGGPLEYDIYRSQDPMFDPDLIAPIDTGIPTTSYADLNTLTSGDKYYYAVRARDLGNGTVDSNAVRVEAIPEGPLANGNWLDDAGDTGTAKFVLDSQWEIEGSEGNLGPNVYRTGLYTDNVCEAITTPPLLLGVGSQLAFSSQYDIEDSYDKGEVQISTDGGANWTRVEVGYPGESTNTSDNCGLGTGMFFTDRDQLGYVQYNADLSAYGSQQVQLRFLISSDGSVTESGWWVDDVSISQVDVPGVCTTGSACDDNPFVDVTPDTGSAVCLGDQQNLSANLTGGVGPFEYQWTRDGLDVVGANGPNLAVNDLGSHAYNVRVRALSCPDAVFDGSPTTLEWIAEPSFAGIESAGNGELATCTIDLDWSAAGTVCPGPIRYTVYRSETSPVAPVIGNQVAGNLSSLSFADTVSMQSSTTYHYLVKATDLSNGYSDTNAVELSQSATGPGSGPQQIYQETFEDALTFPNWTVTTGPGPHDCGPFDRSNSTSQLPGDGSGFFALSDSDACGSGSLTSTTLDSPVIDADIASASSMTLDFALFYNHFNGDDATTEVWDGANWVTVWSDTDVDLNAAQSIDVSAQALGNSDFQVRFNYQNASWDYWYSVDDVTLTAFVDVACTPASSGSAPAPAPDGSLGTQPLRGSRQTVTGDMIDVSWDTASCTANNYNLIYGNLSTVSSYALTGSVCGVGTSGTTLWSGVPAGNLFFLVVGDNGSGSESSWGSDSGGGERNGLAASGECAVGLKETTATCP
ncbi:MAG: immune inhibitor A [Acidobacteriota bacterium]|nr:immune inhibitor A [Acidobacteriota bacterium]